jgi:hypothetical protein
MGGVTLEAGAVLADDAGPTRLDLRPRFDDAPVVVTQVASDNNRQPVATRVSEVVQDHFAVRLQEREEQVQVADEHGPETVHWIAVSVGTGTVDGRSLEVGRTGATVTDGWSAVTFAVRHPDGGFVAAAQTTTEADPAVLRYRRLRAGGVQVRLQEDRTYDQEVAHAAEDVGWVVFGAR